MKTPQFIVVGAPKCGTTALHTYLLRQAGVFVPELKEPHHFASDLPIRRRLSREPYLQLFESSAPELLRGEVSVWYLYSEGAARRIRDLCGEIQIIAMLRDPVQAMRALHGQFVLNGDENINHFEVALEAEPERLQGLRRPPKSWVGARCLCYREVYRYAAQVERYVRLFGRDRVHVVWFDDFAADTRAAYQGVLDTLGVEEPPTAALEPVLRHRRLRWRWLKRLERGLEKPARRLARRLIVRPDIRRRWGRGGLRWLRGLNSYAAERAPLDAALERRLRGEMTPDIRRLESLLGRVTGWALDDATHSGGTDGRSGPGGEPRHEDGKNGMVDPEDLGG